MFQFEVDGFRVANGNGHADASRADGEIRLAEDLAGLVDHLAFFAVQSVAFVAADLGEEVQMDLVRVHRMRRSGIGDLGVKLVDRAPAGARDGLIRVDDDALNAIHTVDRPQGDHQLGRRAVRPGNDAVVLARGFGVHLGHDQRHARIHAPGVGFVDVQRARLRHDWRVGLCFGIPNGADDEVEPLEQPRLGPRLFDDVILAAYCDAFSRAARGREQAQIADRQVRPVTLLEDAHKFASDLACGPKDTNRVTHERPISVSRPCMRPTRFGTSRMARATPGRYASRPRASCRMVRIWPVEPNRTSWWAFSPGRRTLWMRTPPSTAPREPCNVHFSTGGSGRSCSWAARMSRAVWTAVPEGASTFLSWCSSMTSAASMNRAATRAKYIISAPPIAKFAAHTPPRWCSRRTASNIARSLGWRPLVPLTT